MAYPSDLDRVRDGRKNTLFKLLVKYQFLEAGMTGPVELCPVNGKVSVTFRKMNCSCVQFRLGRHSPGQAISHITARTLSSVLSMALNVDEPAAVW